MTQGILSIDQGTTSTRAIVFDKQGKALCSAQQEFTQYFPKNGWVEHDPEEIWQSTLAVCKSVLEQAITMGVDVMGIGITNQRETTLVWDRTTGKPVYNAIVWQDRRTAAMCADLAEKGAQITAKTGLLLDPYFSATKIAWILDHVPNARAQAERGELAFGTIDTFLIWRLTQGQSHVTDTTNASRTNLFNIHTMDWDDELCEWFDVPQSVLPKVLDCAADFGVTAASVLPISLPIAGVAGDQQAALVGQCGFHKGALKSTYGTGCFALLNTGTEPLASTSKLLTTVGYSLNGQTHYALEGSIFTAGANVQWLRDGIQVIDDAKVSQALAESLDYDHGVVLVPAFAGLGAPHWQPNARAALYGMTRDTSSAHFARAALEAVCYQTNDLLNAMAQDGVQSTSVLVDGGMVANDWLCQFLADILQVDIQRPVNMESTALGAAFLAGLQLGLYADIEEISQLKAIERVFTPNIDPQVRAACLARWEAAVHSTLMFHQAL
ncbi:MAG: glycerol kinase GlpK [Glaciecola sp.]|nr:glycerol kinase GlpK [Glaciecola sp.]